MNRAESIGDDLSDGPWVLSVGEKVGGCASGPGDRQPR
jgi:hypothetical protein